MKGNPLPALAGLCCLLALLTSCSAARVGERTGSPQSPAAGDSASAQVAVAPAAAPPSAPAPQIPPAQQPDDEKGGDQQPRDTNAAVPTCLPAPPVAKVPHTHRRPKSAPQQPALPPPTIGAGAETSPDTVINAQVAEIDSAVTSILGKKVQGPKGENLGRVVDILADASGRVRVAIIDFGGFLGVGTRRIAVDWSLLRFNPGGGDKGLLLSISREKLQSAPEYKDAARPRVLMPTAAGETKK
jgi:hypothetical protein